MKNWFNWSVVASLCAFLGVSLWSAHAVFVLNDLRMESENGPLETVQAIVLALAMVAFLAAAAQRGSQRLILSSLGLLSYSFVLRELDVERFALPDALIFIGSGVGRNVSLALAFLAFLLYAASKFSYYKKACWLFLRSRPGILLMVGGLLLFLGDLFENSHFITHNVYFEETAELCGYVFMLLSAFAAIFSNSRRAEGAKTAASRRTGA